jgi:hypothetical protein
MTNQQAIYIINKIFIKSESSVAAPYDLRHVDQHGPITEIRQKMARLEMNIKIIFIS